MAVYKYDATTGQYIETTDASLNITTDQLDYAPGSTAIFTATNVVVGGTVEFSVAHVDPGPDGIVGTADDGLSHDLTGTMQPWTVTDGGLGDADGVANGIIVTSWKVNQDAAYQSFQVGATEAATGEMATAAFTDAPNASAQLDDWNDGPAPDAIGGESWGNGDLNTSNSHFFEGDSVPFRATFKNLVIGQTYTITLSYDTTKAGKHAFDYLTTYNATLPGAAEANPNPTIGTAFTEGGTHDTIAIPTDPRVTAGANGVDDAPAGSTGGDDIAQQSGVFTMWGGDMTATSAYTISGSYANDSDTSITITFTATSTTAVLAWGAHIATEADWGVGSGAFNISGSPYHMALLATDTVNASKADHQMQAATILTPPNPSDTVTKEVTSITSTDGVADTTVADHAGDIINYAVTVTNTGNEALHVTSVADSLPGVTLSLFSGDANNNNLLDTTEVWVYHGSYTVTQADIDNGAVGGGAAGFVHNVATVTTQETGPLSGEANTPIVQSPDLTIVKDADKSSVDAAGQVINYTVTVENTGNVDLTNVVMTDTFAPNLAYFSGDDGDNVLETNETWVYKGTHTVTQAEMNAGTDLVNVASVDTDQTAPKDDNATTTVDQNPDLTIVKDAVVADGHADHAGDVIHYTITVDNTGNVDLTNVVVKDTFEGGAPIVLDINHSTLTTADDAVLTGDDGDGILEVNETWTYKYDHIITQNELDTRGIDGDGSLDNIASVTTTETGPASDDAHILVELGPGVRTPGFWAQSTGQGQWTKFWDGISGNEPKQSGTNGFADGEITYSVDANHNNTIDLSETLGSPSLNNNLKGLLIGDYDGNGVQNGSENVLFISTADALSLLNASSKQVQDGRFLLGRDLVASWLNYLEGNAIGDGSAGTARHDIDDAIKWLEFTQANNGGAENTADFHTLSVANDLTKGTAVPTNSATWNTPVANVPLLGQPIDLAASQLHTDLDHYNNFGSV
jgi:uncharacterized repeat protein (TIGR01451 family)